MERAQAQRLSCVLPGRAVAVRVPPRLQLLLLDLDVELGDLDRREVTLLFAPLNSFHSAVIWRRIGPRHVTVLAIVPFEFLAFVEHD